MRCLGKIAASCGLLFFSLHVSAEVVSGKVIAVHDGDTLTLKTQEEEKKIRLASIDAPELNQPFGIESRDMLKALVLGRSMGLSFRGLTQQVNRYVLV